MIKEYEFYHGVVLARLIHGSKKPLCINKYPTPDNASYVIGEKAGIYIKYSSKRMSPWRFTFLKEHQDLILEMKILLDEVFVIFVCHDNGIACLSYKEFKLLLDENHGRIEWVSIYRGPREKYEVNGQDGKLPNKIGDSDYPTKILNYLDCSCD